MTANELKRRAVALAELERVANFTVPQFFLVPTRRGCDDSTIRACDNSGNSPEIEVLAHRCFGRRLAEGLAEYKAALVKIADVEVQP